MGSPSPEGTVDYSPIAQKTQCEYELTYDRGAIQPSLRDLGDDEFKPGSELPGYSQISLRERVATKCPNSRRRSATRPRMASLFRGLRPTATVTASLRETDSASQKPRCVCPAVPASKRGAVSVVFPALRCWPASSEQSPALFAPILNAAGSNTHDCPHALGWDVEIQGVEIQEAQKAPHKLGRLISVCARRGWAVLPRRRES